MDNSERPASQTSRGIFVKPRPDHRMERTALLAAVDAGRWADRQTERKIRRPPRAGPGRWTDLQREGQGCWRGER